MKSLQLALSLAFASSALANPLVRKDSCVSDSCLAAVTGKAALGDDGLRADHCKSFLATTVTPEAITMTTTITGFEDAMAHQYSKRTQVTVCPNDVPNYASVCETVAYSSACSCFGYFGDSTTTLEPTTTTKTVYMSPTCSGSGYTNTITVTIFGNGTGPTGTASICSPTSGYSGYSGFTSSYYSTITATSTTTVFIANNSTLTDAVTVTDTSTEISTMTITSDSTLTDTATVTVTTDSTLTDTETVTVTSDSTLTDTETVTVTVSDSTTVAVTTTTETVTTTDTTTTTDTATTTTSTPAATCLSQDQVDSFVSAFTDFLENTDKGASIGYSGPFNTALAVSTFTDDFQDYSDAINYMAGYPLGGVTFPSRDAFIGGQGSQYPVGVQTMNTWVGCKHFSWRWVIISGAGPNKPISGINVFEVTDDLSQIKMNYAEFNNGAWIEDIGNPASLCGASSSSTTTTTAATTGATTTADATTTTEDATTTTTVSAPDATQT